MVSIHIVPVIVYTTILQVAKDFQPEVCSLALCYVHDANSVPLYRDYHILSINRLPQKLIYSFYLTYM